MVIIFFYNKQPMASFSKFVNVLGGGRWGGDSKVVSYKYKGAAPVALYHPGNFLTLRVVV